LERARWATADMAYRRATLQSLGGFDERFVHAYREDADLGLRAGRHGGEIVKGRRVVLHPVRPADRWVSIRLQRGNADDPLMRALHGPRWRDDAAAPPGRLRRHLLVTACAVTAAGAAVLRRPRVAAVAVAGWAAGTLELATARILPGPRTAGEVATMVLTSAVLPPAATYHWLRGVATLRARLGDTRRAASPPRPRAVLFDRDGTLVVDVPYNGDPDRVEPVRGARSAVQRLRRAGVRVGVVSNQSGVARGLLTAAQVEAVNARVDELLGPFDTWQVCTHGPSDHCDCRKPQPGMVVEAARRLGVDPSECVVVGDIGADVEAAAAAGCRAVLVPTARTRVEEVGRAPLVARDLSEAVDLLLGGAR
jgi:HAD superfamily hydrolase (TIGR01662 family)